MASPQRLGEVPPAIGDRVVLPEEAGRLDAVDDATLDDLLARLVAAHPRVAEMSPAHRARTREDLRWIVRFTGAAVLTADPTVLDDFLSSLLRILHGRVPDDVVLDGADLAADGIERTAPSGATMLRAAVQRARAAG